MTPCFPFRCLFPVALLTVSAAATPPVAETYHWANVAIGGGGFVTGVKFHPRERGLAYARTDVGGAYRWDAAGQRWVPLLDWLSSADWNLMGVESLALDPTDPERIYLAAGTYTRSEVGTGEILRSDDRGVTWQRTPLPFRFGGNEAGRGSGERLMVDPNFPQRLYLGTRRDGLWQSDDFGVGWARVAGFPELPDSSAGQPAWSDGHFNPLSQAIGLIWVRVDASRGARGKPTPVVYAAVSRSGESIFRSTDAGATWAAVPGQPTALRPVGAALAPDGTMYVTYGDGPGPGRMSDGAVWKFSPSGNAWSEITPEKPDAGNPERRFGYAAVAVDPADAATLLVSTSYRGKPGDEIFRSTDAGRTWRPLMATATWDHSSAPYTETMFRHWMSAVELDPFDRNQIVFNTGYGLWESTNATAADSGLPVNWVFHNRGLEETVPLAVISPTEGAHLLSGLGDIDGFVHDDLTVSPAGRFSSPGFKNTEWLDYAALAPAQIVRSGTTYGDDRLLAAFSADGGRTWRALAGEPPRTTPGKPRFATGPIAISADGKVITWTLRGERPYFTSALGQTWQPANGVPKDVRLVGDRVEPQTFYGYDSVSGRLFVATKTGAEFSRLPHLLPVLVSPPWRHDYGTLVAVPGRAGECWLAAGGRLFALSDHGQTLRSLAKLSGVTALGFGRAAPGANYPAVFVAATLGDESGLYRSDDAGVKWVRLTDAQHRYGAITQLTGDPRIFGRVYFCTGGRGLVCGDRAQ